jgi:hypothetical protein
MATIPAEIASDMAATDAVDRWPAGEILRDIARGGLAGLVVGVVVAGLGGRVVMRVAGLLVPSANGSFTENGNRIGDITLAGSVGLIVFVGLLAALIFGVVWVVISPWLPASGVIRGLVAMPIAVALGAFGLIDRGNRDFAILGHDPLVVASLVALVALSGPAMVVADGWLDRRLPHAASAASRAGIVYLLLSVVGGLFGGLLLLQAAVGRESQPLGITIIAVGFVTAAWWYRRVRGQNSAPRPLRIAARLILLVGTVAGYMVLVPEVTGALGLP